MFNRYMAGEDQTVGETTSRYELPALGIRPVLGGANGDKVKIGVKSSKRQFTCCHFPPMSMQKLVPILALAFLSAIAVAQISPGPLSRAHQELDGATHCTTCHKLGGGEPAFRCLDCHAEIASRLAARRGLHSSYGIRPGSSQECAKCHSDHNGPDFPIVKWDTKNFEHKQTGYPVGRKARRARMQEVPHSRPHSRQRARPDQGQGPQAHLPGRFRSLRHLPQGSARRAARQQLLAVPQFQRLEKRFRDIRSLEDPLSADRAACAGQIATRPALTISLATLACPSANATTATPRNGTCHRRRARRSRAFQTHSLSLAHPTSLQPLARGAQTVQLHVCSPGARPHWRGVDDGFFLDHGYQSVEKVRFVSGYAFRHTANAALGMRL